MPRHAERRHMPEGPPLCVQMTHFTWLTPSSRRKYLNMPKSNMERHAERRHMPEGPPLCVQMTHFTWLTPSSRRKYLNMPKSNMPKHAERGNMPEGPHLCMQKSKLKHAKIKHAEARSRPTGESAETWQNQTCRSKRKVAHFTWLTSCCHALRLPRKVPRRHRRPSQSKRATQCHLSHACHVKRRWMSPSATPVMWNEGECHQVPRLPRKVPRRHRRPSQSKRATQCHLSHACHVKRRWMSRSATPATWKEVNVTKCRACHAKCRGVTSAQASPSAPPSAMCPTPATWNEGECHEVPRLPRETKVNVTKCCACHAKCRGVTSAQASPSAPPSAICPTPATWNEGECHEVPRLPREKK